MAISLQADSTLPQGYILVDGQRAATVSTTGLSAVLAPNTVTTSSLVSGAVTTEKIAPGAVVTADLADGAVTAAKMAGGQTGSAPVYGCRAWVNFNGSLVENAPSIAYTGLTVSVTAGNAFGILNNGAGGLTNAFIGNTIKFPSILGVTGGTLGGVDVATRGVQYTELISGNLLRFRFLSGQIPTSNQTIAGVTGNAAAGFTYQNLGIRESGNVSSVIKNSVGNYTINFTVPMPTAHYTWVSNAERGGSASQRSAQTFANTPESLQIFTTLQGSTAGEDMEFIRIAIFC